MNDIGLLLLMSDRDNYNRYRGYIKSHAVSKETLMILNNMGVYFDEHSDLPSIEFEEFSSWFRHIKNVKLGGDELHLYGTLFEILKEKQETEETDISVADLINHYNKVDYATRMANILLDADGTDYSTALSSVKDLVNELEASVTSSGTILDKDMKERLFVETDIRTIVKERSSTPGLDWRLEELNISCGSLRKGMLVEVAARPDSGKTTFLASEASYLATQLGEDDHILWINNEEEGTKVIKRIYSAALSRSGAQIDADYEKAYDDYVDLMGSADRILLRDQSSISVKEIEQLLSIVRPKVIIIDQLDKIKGFEKKEVRDDLRLQALYQWAREIAKEYGPVIATCQADASADGVKWIGMGQLYGSKTMKQGEADIIITIGRLNDPENAAEKNKRYIHTPKNKTEGGPRFDEDNRNGYWEVEIDPVNARYKGEV